jgi:hypothetical protein
MILIIEKTLVTEWLWILTLKLLFLFTLMIGDLLGICKFLTVRKLSSLQL